MLHRREGAAEAEDNNMTDGGDNSSASLMAASVFSVIMAIACLHSIVSVRIARNADGFGAKNWQKYGSQDRRGWGCWRRYSTTLVETQQGRKLLVPATSPRQQIGHGDLEKDDMISSASRRTALLALGKVSVGWLATTPFPVCAASTTGPSTTSGPSRTEDVDIITATQPAKSTGPSSTFRSKASNLRNYSNSVVASRDTNVSPGEAYDVILEKTKITTDANGFGDIGGVSGQGRKRALDLGAGAGVSTQLLWDNGYRKIDAVDPSDAAWRKFVTDNDSTLPNGLRFFHLSDDAFVAAVKRGRGNVSNNKETNQQQEMGTTEEGKGEIYYDMVVCNYAINSDKAKALAKDLVKPVTGRLLAPVNAQTDYWFGQEYRLMDSEAKVLWRQDVVSGWSVTFQPDYTAPTCMGQWCPNTRGEADKMDLNLKN